MRTILVGVLCLFFVSNAHAWRLEKSSAQVIEVLDDETSPASSIDAISLAIVAEMNLANQDYWAGRRNQKDSVGEASGNPIYKFEADWEIIEGFKILKSAAYNQERMDKLDSEIFVIERRRDRKTAALDIRGANEAQVEIDGKQAEFDKYDERYRAGE